MSESNITHHNSPYVRRNFLCHVLEGGFYMGGTAFLAPESVMPKMVQTLGGLPWVIAVMPVLLPAAFACAGLFIAPVVERLDRFKPWVLGFGLLQRLPYLITGLILMFATNLDGSWLLPLVVLTPVVSGLIGGLTVVAWMEMVTRMVPEKVRAAGWSARYIMQAVIAVGAGTMIHQVLTHIPGRMGYAWLHLAAFALLFISWLAQLPMKEQSGHPVAPRPIISYAQYLRELPALFRQQRHLKKLVFARFFGNGFLMLVSFLTIHALEVTGRPEADEGSFVTWQAIGTVLGSLLAGYVGYRSGGKVLLQCSRIVCVALCLWVGLNETFPGFTVAYFALGFGLFLDRVGDLTLAAELCPTERRSALQAILGFFNVFSLLLATTLSGQVYRITQSFHAVAWLAAVCAVISMLLLARIPEPRNQKRS